MKKILFICAGVLLFNINTNAQQGRGGIPLSLNSDYTITEAYIPQFNYATPDWEAYEAEEAAEMEAIQEGEDVSLKPYIVALLTNTDIKFPESGVFDETPNGVKVWRTKMHIKDAPAIGLYFDQFKLPYGAEMYIYNENKKQILGAYTIDNIGEDGLFAVEAVQGEYVNIELNILLDVQLEDIQISINQAAVYYRSISYLSRFADDPELIKGMTIVTGSPDSYGLEGNSSICQINAKCFQGDGYEISRKSSVQLLFLRNRTLGMCSASLINNTGNTKDNCKAYILTASHCDGANNTNSTAFATTLVRFNFEKEQCRGGDPATVNTLSRLNFVARSNYLPTNTPKLNGDFLLLEYPREIPASYDAYLAGWNRDPRTQTSLTSPKKFIIFSHPSGDIKKVATTNQINPNGQAGGTDGPGTHWAILVKEGGIEQGSSGSSLFDGEGRIIGITSTAGVSGNANNSCRKNGKGGNTLYMNYATFGKMSYSWDYSKDGNSAIRKLKYWLDPAKTGAMTINPATSFCKAVKTAVVEINKDEFSDNSVAIYPNPSVNGVVNAVFNLKEKRNIQVQVYSFTGALLKSFDLKDVANSSYALDLKELSNGMYIVKFNTENGSIVKKVSIIQ